MTISKIRDNSSKTQKVEKWPHFKSIATRMVNKLSSFFGLIVLSPDEMDNLKDKIANLEKELAIKTAALCPMEYKSKSEELLKRFDEIRDKSTPESTISQGLPKSNINEQVPVRPKLLFDSSDLQVRLML